MLSWLSAVWLHSSSDFLLCVSSPGRVCSFIISSNPVLKLESWLCQRWFLFNHGTHTWPIVSDRLKVCELKLHRIFLYTSYQLSVVCDSSSPLGRMWPSRQSRDQRHSLLTKKTKEESFLKDVVLQGVNWNGEIATLRLKVSAMKQQAASVVTFRSSGFTSFPKLSFAKLTALDERLCVFCHGPWKHYNGRFYDSTTRK